jgi:GTP-binding protein
MEGRDLLEDYDAIRRELGRYRPELLDRREIVVLNKIDVASDERVLEAIEARLGERGIVPQRISGATGQGVAELARTMLDAVDGAIVAEREEAERLAAAGEGGS